MPDVGDRERLHDHILGSLAAAALGDAMGAATEQHAIPEILEEHGGLLNISTDACPITVSQASCIAAYRMA